MNMWSPWHGCRKISEGCENCYMYYLDSIRGKDGSEIYRTKSGFYYPIEQGRSGEYKVKSGETISVCMSSDFFLEEADEWRMEAWNMIRERSDVKFFIITKRVARIEKCLPEDWGDGYENVIINATCENMQRADERLPVFLDIPMKHRGIACSPLIGEIHLDKYLASGKIDEVSCGGENYNGARICDYEWVKIIHDDCLKNGVNFFFFETGTNFRKDGRIYHMPSKRLQSKMAFKSAMSFKVEEKIYHLKDKLGNEIEKGAHIPNYSEHCSECASKIYCNGCNNCGKCRKK